MSEYWKSTPKYWCKYCAVYVKDTKFERANHEATGRHQGSIQRSLRGLHREQQNQERQTERAKNEVARLNGIVGTPSSSSDGGAVAAGRKPVSSSSSREPERKATLEDRKRQWDQLVSMGIAVPEEVRPDMAIAGEWQVVSQKIIGGDEDEKELNKGVHKRKLDEDEEEALEAQQTITKHKGWGHSFKRYPGKAGGDVDDDVDALFKKVKKPAVKKETDVAPEPVVKQENLDVKGEAEEPTLQDIPIANEASTNLGQGLDADATPRNPIDETKIKTEEAAPPMRFKKVVNMDGGSSPKVDSGVLDSAKDDGPAPAVVFKKRKKLAR
ncbi:hypothetical protein BCR34DRAFT_625925 [Clohesyomyces aquaticus]|uniref:U1-C C2H2-type zinc finger domain-containing protein n=1 Tax=Clohesyomyces aquaticus TaxID=1231657 RepID=A0A1Y1ZGE7_9PLEO|nr:hypothetical protein BCR34DRAFT_625925 [Clohesyomyces aquaticus]